MNVSRLLPFLVGCAVLLAAGCSTPEARVRKNPEIFNRLAIDEQELIIQGKVGIGFDQDMVRLALGEPDRIWTRTDMDGATQAWSYTTYETSDGHPLYRGWYHRYYGPYYGWHPGYYPYYMSYPARREREVLKVVFKDGRVISIEEESRS